MVSWVQLLGVVAGIFVAALQSFVSSSQKRIYALSSSSPTSSSSSNETSILLLRSPNALSAWHMVLLFLTLLTKYIPGTEGYRMKLRASNEHDQRFALPRIRVESPLTFDQSDHDRFTHALFRSSSQRQQQEEENVYERENLLFLVSLTSPLVIFILSLHRCPVKPLGAVNTRNVFHFADMSTCQDGGELRRLAQSEQLMCVATFGGPTLDGVRRKRGMEFSIVVEIRRKDNGNVLVRQELYFLQFLPSSVKPRFRPEMETKTETKIADENEPLIKADLPPLSVAAPRRWAASCKDYNPIHISTLAAKLFGFASTIAHGNHAVALALDQSLDAVQQRQQHQFAACTLTVSFVKPMLLPLSLQAQWRERQRDNKSSSFALSIEHKTKAYVSGDLLFNT